MAEDEARLVQIEHTLARLDQIVRDSWDQMAKQLGTSRQQTEGWQEGMQVRLNTINQRFTDLQERLTGMEGRLGTLDDRLDTRLGGLDARLDTRLGEIDDRLNTRLMGVEGRLSAIESRLDSKAGNWTVNLWGATLALLVGAATAFLKLAR